MTDGLRVTGWGMCGFPGEKRRLKKAQEKADALLQGLEPGPRMDVTVETTYDFSTGSVCLSVEEEQIDLETTSIEDQRELRASIIAALLDEASMYSPVNPPEPDQIEWERAEAVGRAFITATLRLEDS